MSPRHAELIADRGNVDEFPENSFVGVRSALALGALAVRIDIQLSADGIPMLAHDIGLLRTTGNDQSVLNLAAETLTETCVGEPARFGDLFADVGMPRLNDVLPLLDEYPDATYFIDLQHASIAHFGHEQVVQALIDSCRRYRQRVVVLSTDLPSIYRARQAHGFRIGWRVEQLDSHTRLKYQALLPEFIVCEVGALAESSRLQRGPWSWIATDVIDVDQLRRAETQGFGYVATLAWRTLRAAATPA
jgi:glycerophosphoryl diester phosphodiesterase